MSGNLRVVNSTITTNIEDSEGLLSCAARFPPPLKTRKRVLRHRQTHRFNHLRIKHPRIKSCHYLAYPNGKVVVLGCKSVDEIEDALAWLGKETGSTKLLTYKLHNLVGSVKFDTALNLTQIYNKILSQRGPKQYIGYYESELSPALVFAPLSINTVRCLLFRSGSVIITGGRSVSDLNIAHKELKELMT